MTKLEITKEECLRMAHLEGDAEIGAGKLAQDCPDWVRLAGPNDRFNYGMRKRSPGTKMILGNEAVHFGMQLWSISDGVATAPDGTWEFINNVHWYSIALPPAPEQPTD